MRDYVRTHALDLRALDDAARRHVVATLGQTLMQQIGLIIPALPVPLVAAVLMRDPQRSWSELELKSEVQELMKRIEALGAHVYLPRSDREYAITVGLRMLLLRRLVQEQDGLHCPNPQELPVLAYYANSIAHLQVQCA